MRIRSKTKKTYHLVFEEEELKTIWKKIVKVIDYDYPEEWWLTKGPVDELEEFLIKIKQELSKNVPT